MKNLSLLTFVFLLAHSVSFIACQENQVEISEMREEADVEEASLALANEQESTGSRMLGIISFFLFNGDSFPCAANSQRCFRNPGFLDGYTMHKEAGLRNGQACFEYCVPVRTCSDTTGYTGPFTPIDFRVCTKVRYDRMNWLKLIGWGCGPCP